MSFEEKLNQQVLNATGFDVPELSGGARVSREEALAALRHAKRWHEDFATQCQNQIDNIIANNFTLDERTAEA